MRAPREQGYALGLPAERQLLLCCSALLLVVCLACQKGQITTQPADVPPPPAAAGFHEQAPRVLSIVGLNDLHGHLEALPVFAGFVNNLREARRADGGDVLVVDAGDMFQGTLESNLSEGQAVVDAYEAMGLHAAAIGNHEFDFGPVGKNGSVQDGSTTAARDPHGALKQRLKEADFPLLSANLIYKETGKLVDWPGLEQRVVVELSGVKIGITGVLTRETPEIVMPAYFVGLDVAPLAPSVIRQARLLREEGAELVVVLAHAGADCPDMSDPYDTSSCKEAEVIQLAKRVPKGLVDVIVAGHKHQGVAHIVNDIAIVESYKNGRAFSRVDVVFDVATRRVLDKQVFLPEPLCPEKSPCRFGPYAGKRVEAEAKVARALRPALAQARSIKKRLLGPDLNPSFFASGTHECPVGNLFADLMLAAVPDADVAITNGGGLRAHLPEGPLTYGSVFEAMPFDNYLATFTVSARELRRVFERHLSHDRHGLVSVAGIRVHAYCEDPSEGLRVELVRPQKEDSWTHIPNDEKLLVVTSDYLATGGDGLFSSLKLDRNQIDFDSSRLLRDMLAERIQGYTELSPGAFYDESEPRLILEKPRPVDCPGRKPEAWLN